MWGGGGGVGGLLDFQWNQQLIRVDDLESPSSDAPDSDSHSSFFLSLRVRSRKRIERKKYSTEKFTGNISRFPLAGSIQYCQSSNTESRVFSSLTECNKSKSKCRYSPLKQLVVPAGEVPTLFYSLLLRALQSRMDTDIAHFYGKYRNPKFGPNREIDTTQRNIEGCQQEGRVECCGGVEVLL